MSISGKAAIVGASIRHYKRGASPYGERELAIRAIVEACEDAGLDPRDVDGFCSFGHDHHDGPHLGPALGTRELRWSTLAWGGGGGGLVAAVESAAVAIATGRASAVAVYRSLAERDSGRLSAAVSSSFMNAHYRAQGFISPAQICALRAQYMIEREGVPAATMRAVVEACYHHAQQNPDATGHGRPFDADAYETARWIVEPYRLFDCSRENDGAGAILLVSAERAARLGGTPVFVAGAVQGAGEGWGENWENCPDYGSAGFKPIARRLWAETGLSPRDVDCAQIYENFSGQAVATIIDMGFCTAAEAGEFVRFPNLIAQGGTLPINTSGGNIAEGFVHGIGLLTEGVRQLRGQSTNHVPGAKTCLVTGGPVTTLSSMMLLATA